MGKQSLATAIILMADLITNSKTDRGLSERVTGSLPVSSHHIGSYPSMQESHVFTSGAFPSYFLMQHIWKQEKKGMNNIIHMVTSHLCTKESPSNICNFCLHKSCVTTFQKHWFLQDKNYCISAWKMASLCKATVLSIYYVSGAVQRLL